MDTATRDDELDELRRLMGDLLADGLTTDWRRRAYTGDDVKEVIHDLGQLGRNDHVGKLRVAGFTGKPYVPPEEVESQQSCSTCMYYERHRKYCTLPELNLPVEPEWSCVLWRV